MFSWNQSRHYLPGWYGIGTALDELAQRDPKSFRLLTDAAVRWPFLRYVLNNVEGNLSSANLDLMRRYSGLVRDEKDRDHIFSKIAEEYTRTKAVFDALFGAPLTERRPRMWRTLALREHALERLHTFQIEALQCWRRALREGETAESESALANVLTSVNAIANGLRTTG